MVIVINGYRVISIILPEIQKAQSLLELRDLGQLARERSQASLRQRTSSRQDGRNSALNVPLDDLYEKIDHLEIQIVSDH